MLFMPGTRWARALPGLALLGVLASCTSGPVPRDHFYRLSPPPPRAKLAEPLRGGLTVEALETDALTGERPILFVAGDPPVEISQHYYHHWTEAPGGALQHALAAHLREAGLADEVVTPELRIPTRYRVTGRVKRFERVLDPKQPRVVVEMRLTIQDTREGRLVASETYEAVVPAKGPEVTDSIAAFDSALGQIYDRFARDAAGRSIDEPAL